MRIRFVHLCQWAIAHAQVLLATDNTPTRRTIALFPRANSHFVAFQLCSMRTVVTPAPLTATHASGTLPTIAVGASALAVFAPTVSQKVLLSDVMVDVDERSMNWANSAVRALLFGNVERDTVDESAQEPVDEPADDARLVAREQAASSAPRFKRLKARKK